MIKLIASDLDGTILLNGAQSLPDGFLSLICQLKELGILFVAASGRQYPNMKRLFEPVLSDIAFVCENGAMAIKNEEVLYHDAFEPELVHEIVKTIYEREGTEFSCSAKDYYYVRPKTQHYLDHMTKTIGFDCKVIHSFDEITEPCMKMAVYEQEGTKEESIRYWQSRFSDRCKVVTSGATWVDFVPFQTNKANGIRKFQELLGAKPEECMVFGDESNDIEMLKCVPYSFAMSHSRDSVKDAANYQTERVEVILKKLIEAKGNIEEII